MSEDLTPRLNAALEGRYAIERQLGEGGMATVYLADDLKHERKVALKVLKPELAAVVGAERFLAEIKTTANLQHPHILPLFDSGEADSFLFYVMPYMEGETLRDRIEREKQLPVDEAVRIATAVANALDHAHRHGVIHRDIKPANILLQDGEPVVADFGIALAMGSAGGARLTETGLSVGTPFYMSPEQATGDQNVGTASDTYALACVLYEMLVGEPPYLGNTAQAVLGKIIAGAFVSPTEQRQSIPLNVDAAVRKALEKLPADRFTSAHDFGRALADPGFRHGVEAGAAGAAPGRWNGLSRSLAGVAAVLAVALGWSLVGRSPTDTGVRWQRVQLLDEGAFGTGVGSVHYGIGIAPDGSAIAVADTLSKRLLLKTPEQAEPLPIPGTEGEDPIAPVFSPDGQWIAYFSRVDRTLRKVPRVGGAPIVLADSIAATSLQAAWLDDGTILFNRLGWHLDRVPEDGGPVERVVDVAGTGTYVGFVSALPDARGALIQICTSQCQTSELQVLDLETLERSTLMPGAVGAWYMPTGHLVIARRDGGVVAAPFDLTSLELTGPAVPVLDGVQTIPQWADLTISASGTLLYSRGEAVTDAGGGWELVWVDREGRATALQEGWQEDFTNPALSADDRLLAVSIGNGRQRDLYVKQLPDGPLTRLTNDQNWNRRPVFAPDGRSIVFQTSVIGDSTQNQFFRVRRADASAPAETFLDLDEAVHQVTWSGDGEQVVYRLGSVGAGADLWLVNTESDSARTPLLTADYDEKAPALSPDGRWLAYVSNESGTDEVEVRPFPNVMDARVQISIGGGREPRWSPDGDELFYRSLGESWMMAATVETDPDFQILERERLFPWLPVYRSDNADNQYAVSQDAQRFLMIRNVARGEAGTDGGTTLPVFYLAENWLDELKERTGG